jgi:spore maturation protein CgeB
MTPEEFLDSILQRCAFLRGSREAVWHMAGLISSAPDVRGRDRDISSEEQVAESQSRPTHAVLGPCGSPGDSARVVPKQVSVADIGNGRPRLLYLVMREDYGIPGRGPSHEWCNVVPALEGFGLETRHFDYAQELIEHGYWESQARLRALVDRWRPHVLFIFMYQEQVDRELIRWVSESTPTVTLGWFADDHWRFDTYSRFWAKALNWVLTTDVSAVEKYGAAGQPNVILTQWAANEIDYHPTGTGLHYDVTFVGQPHGRRVEMVDYLRRKGVDVRAWGPGWPNGRATQAQLVEVFSSSRINLNMSSSSVSFGWGRGRDTDQIKGRVFEVPACGGLLMTDSAPGLDRYFRVGEEIVVYRSRRDLLRQVGYLLDHEEQRARIARAGYERTIRDHTWRSRFAEVFEAIGLPLDGATDGGRDGR